MQSLMGGGQQQQSGMSGQNGLQLLQMLGANGMATPTGSGSSGGAAMPSVGTPTSMPGTNPMSGMLLNMLFNRGAGGAAGAMGAANMVGAGGFLSQLLGLFGL